MLKEECVSITSTLYLGWVRVIASLVTVQQALAKIPCNPKLFPSARLLVNWPQLQYDSAHTSCNPSEFTRNSSNAGRLATKWSQAAGEASYTWAVVRGRRFTNIPGNAR